MKIRKFGLAVIIFFGILILYMSIYSVYTDYYYDDVYAQGGSSQSEISSPWTTGAPLPTPRSEIAGAALKGKIYIIGGFDQGGKSTATVEVYDPIADRWTSAAPLPWALDHPAAATSYDGKLYVVGGGWKADRDALSNKLFIYDPTTNKWTEGANLPAARGALTANFIGEILYAVGGVDVSGASNANLAYDPVTNTWTEKASMPTAREHLTSAVVNGKLYVIGGRTAGMEANVNANEVYDPVVDKWNVLESMPSKRGGLTSAAVNETIYVFGGEEPSSTFNDNEKYNPKTNIWTSDTPMPTARHGLAAVAIGDKIYVIGGGPEPGISQTDANEIFHYAMPTGKLKN